MVPLRLPVRFLYSVTCLRLQTDVSCTRKYYVGILVLLPNYHRSRSLVEGNGISLSTANDCWYRLSLSWSIPVGIHCYGTLHSLWDKGEPRADDVLLPVYHPLHGDSLPCKGCAWETTDRLYEVDRRRGSCRSDWYCNQSIEPLSHMAVSEGEHARQEWVGKEECRQSNKLWFRPWLHNTMELWHWWDSNALSAWCEGWGYCPIEQERHCYGKSRPTDTIDDTATLWCNTTILWYAARH